MRMLAAALALALNAAATPVLAQSSSGDPRHPNFAIGDPRLDAQRAGRPMQACADKARELAGSFGYELPAGEPLPDGQGRQWTLTGGDTDVSMTCTPTTAGSVRFDARYQTTQR
jgi:hypothetical protein